MSDCTCILSRRLSRALSIVITAVTVGALSAGCGSVTSEPDEASPVTAGSDYCAGVNELTHVLGDGGSVDRYNVVLRQVLTSSPPAHQESWGLLLSVSEQQFSYERFNQAADSFERAAPSLTVMCPDLDPMIVVDDEGRLRVYTATP